MTAFAYPIVIRRPPLAKDSDTFSARAVVAVPVTLDTTNTGTAASTTTIPLFIAPAGSRVLDAYIDKIIGYDNTNGVTVQVGTSALPACIMAATSLNTTGRLSYAGTAAQVSANNLAFDVDTTIQAIVSITTTAVTTGKAVITVVLM